VDGGGRSPVRAVGGGIAGVLPTDLAALDVSQLAAGFADGVRRFVEFAAEHPELNQIMVHEAPRE